MTDAQPLDLARVMNLVTEAMKAAYFGVAPDAAAAEILEAQHPTALELASARRENQEVHGGHAAADVRAVIPATPVPGEVVRVRQLIDDVLAAAERQLGSGDSDLQSPGPSRRKQAGKWPAD